MTQFAGGAYEVRVKEFPQPGGTTESQGVPAEVTTWVDGNTPGTTLPGGGSIDRVFIPYFLGAIGSGNPVWIAVYVVWMHGGH